MQDKDYRHGLVSAQIEVDLPLQIRALRKQRELSQPQLADLADMKQSRISTMEKSGGARFTLETLRRLAKALDVALIVRFAPFGELVKWSRAFDPDAFSVPSFEAEQQGSAVQQKNLDAVRMEEKPVIPARRRISRFPNGKCGTRLRHRPTCPIPGKVPRADVACASLQMTVGHEAVSGLLTGCNESAGHAGRIGGVNGTR